MFSLNKLPLIYLWTLLFLLSCSKVIDYKIIDNENGIVVLELPGITTADTLTMIAEEVRNEIEEDYPLILFTIPSEYPDFPDVPWAMYDFSGPEGDISVSRLLRIHGAQTKQQRENLLKIKGDSEHRIGKWFRKYPMLETMIIMEEWNENVIVNWYYIDQYAELDGKEDKPLAGEKIPHGVHEPNSTEYLERSNSKNEFVDDNNGKWKIDKKGRLIQIFPDDNNRVYLPVE